MTPYGQVPDGEGDEADPKSYCFGVELNASSKSFMCNFTLLLLPSTSTR